jgi:hypothetical protein
MLPLVPGLEFHPKIHRYRYKNRWLLTSVTKVANRTTPEQAKQFERTRHIWEPRGKTIHSFCEALLLDQQKLGGEYEAWTQALEDCWLFQGCEPLAVEYTLCDYRKGIAGTFDFLLKTSSGKIVLGDLKTVGNHNSLKRRKPATAQLGGYLSMLIDHHPTVTVDWCYTVVSGPEECKVLQNTPDECLAAWVDAWDVYKLENYPF